MIPTKITYKEKVFHFNEKLGQLKEKRTGKITKLSYIDCDSLAFWLKKKNISMVEISMADIFGDEHD